MTDTASPAPSEREKFEAWLPAYWPRETYRDDEGEELFCDLWVQGAWMGWLGRANRPAPPAVAEAIKALVHAAFLEGGVSPERTAQARAETEARKAELIALIGAAGKPLTDEQIAGIARSVLETPVADGVAPAWTLAVGIARAIEAAHGIGIKKGNSHGLPT